MSDDDGDGGSDGKVKDFDSQELQGNASELFDAIAEQPTCSKDFISQNAASVLQEQKQEAGIASPALIDAISPKDFNSPGV
eukprot:4823378-Karenia_brevis.AAC.1